jgi:hypothetical protein
MESERGVLAGDLASELGMACSHMVEPQSLDRVGGKWQILIESVPAAIKKKLGSVWKQGCWHSQQPTQNTLRMRTFLSSDMVM